MTNIRRRVNAAVNPLSTAFTRWWCHSALRHLLTGHGPTARQRRLIRRATPVTSQETPATNFPPSAPQMDARRKAIDDLLAQHDPQA